MLQLLHTSKPRDVLGFREDLDIVSLVPASACVESTMTRPTRPRNRDAFQIALLCSLTKESDAVEALFDGCWRDHGGEFGKVRGDNNIYTTGWIGQHNIVLVYMPGMGKVNAANVSSNILLSFIHIRLCLVVGICGGIPHRTNQEMLLGDVVISTEIIQYDMGTRYSDNFVQRDTNKDECGQPNREIRAFLHQIRAKVGLQRLRSNTAHFVKKLCDREDFQDSQYPGPEYDKLYEKEYRHKHRNPKICEVCAQCEKSNDAVCSTARQSTCEELGCEKEQLVTRPRLEKLKKGCLEGTKPIAERLRLDEPAVTHIPFIHFGSIASGDWVMKSETDRDQVDKHIIAYEIGGAGVWENIPTLIIKAVCDYADSHKNNEWQEYAAATAAACAKAALIEWPKLDDRR